MHELWKKPMPDDNENPIEDAIEAASHASEQLTAGHHKDKGYKLKEVVTFMTALAALLAAIGAFWKTFDHSVTEGTYKTTTDLIVKLDERQQKSEADIAGIRGYLDGLSHAPITIPVPNVGGGGMGGSGGSPNTNPIPTLRPIPWPPASASAFHPTSDGGLITLAIQAPPLPPPRAPAPPVRPPSFDVAAAAK
jgi:hypothetical protein